MPLITFEGSEGCGKSTQVRRLAAFLEAHGIAPMLLREPGGTAIGENIRHLLQHAEENRGMCPQTELLLFAASRSQLVREKILPALQRREFVICDRFFDSTTIYQGVARRLERSFVRTLNRFAVADAIPDLTFILDVSRAEARRRLAGRPQVRDRLEELPEAFFVRVTKAYREMAKTESARMVLIDAMSSADQVEQRIRAIVLERFPELVSSRSFVGEMPQT